MNDSRAYENEVRNRKADVVQTLVLLGATRGPGKMNSKPLDHMSNDESEVNGALQNPSDTKAP